MSLEKAVSIEALQSIVEAANPSPVKKKPLLTRLKFIMSHITVEPVMLFFILPSMMVTIAAQNLNLEKACRVNLRISTEHCDAITVRNESAYPEYTLDEERVQTLATYMAMLRNTLQSIIPAIILLFLGSWSDRFLKRKPCMIVPLLGEMTSVTCFIICTYFFLELPMQVNAICEAFFPAITGTWFAMFCGVYSYISDVSSEEDRTVRIGAINMLVNVSMCVGTALSGILYKTVGFYGVFGSALALQSLSLAYCCLFVTDTCKLPKDKGEVCTVKSRGFCRDFFQCDNIKDTFRTAIKSDPKRPGRKLRVCAIMALYIVICGPLYGELNVVYFYVRLRFGWDAIEYSAFATFQFVTNTLGTMFSLAFFSKFLKLDDSILGIISCSTKILACGLYAFAPGIIYFYAASGEVDFKGTFNRIWENHLTELVQCEKCDRKFFPDRIEKHREACIGLKIDIQRNKIKNKK